MTIGYEDPIEKLQKTDFLKSQEALGTKIVLEAYDATLPQLQEILPLCKNIVGLKLTNSTYRPGEWMPDIYPDDKYIEAITTTQNLSTLEYLCIQEWKKITTQGAILIANTRIRFPALKYFRCEALDSLKAPNKEPEIFGQISLREDLKLFYGGNDYKEIEKYYDCEMYHDWQFQLK